MNKQKVKINKSYRVYDASERSRYPREQFSAKVISKGDDDLYPYSDPDSYLTTEKKGVRVEILDDNVVAHIELRGWAGGYIRGNKGDTVVIPAALIHGKLKSEYDEEQAERKRQEELQAAIVEAAKLEARNRVAKFKALGFDVEFDEDQWRLATEPESYITRENQPSRYGRTGPVYTLEEVGELIEAAERRGRLDAELATDPSYAGSLA
jgi:hypothetical protein